MNIRNKETAKRIFKRIDYMAYEINLYIGKTILVNGFSNKYANKYSINRKNLNIEFYLYNIETKTTACKSIDITTFLKICRNKTTLQNKSYEYTEQLLEACDKPAKNIIYIK